ncbi:MAG: hypothetical protein JRH01_22400 [Deltaproteobacteria bacterium]|nr:hypothetical protein [Deltaproteobacteria bacterium]MBW2396454.1 hypothetical protein [Deltaproteobacteria bacterium]
MNSDRTLLNLVDHLYEAVVRPEKWHEFVAQFAEATRLDTACGMAWEDAAPGLVVLHGYEDDAAERRSTTTDTARTQLKRILEKTRTRRQSELIRLFLTGPLAMEEGPSRQ